MSDTTAGDDAELQAERDRLAAEVERLKDAPGKRLHRRRIAAVVFVVLTLLATSLSIPGVWARRTLLNTDRYVATVDELAMQPAVQQAIAGELTTAVFDALDVQARLREVIGERAPNLTFLAGPISDAVEGFVQDQVLKIVQSEAFATFWSQANRLLHEQVLAILRGDTDVVTIEGDQVVFNYLPLVNQALTDLSSVLSDLLGRTVTLPTITEDTVPSQAVTALETALGVDLPETFGQVVIVQSDALQPVQQGFRAANAAAIALVVLIALFFTLALVVSPTKRRTLLQLAVGIFIVTVIERRITIIGTNELVADVSAGSQAAARQITDVLLDSLLSMTLWIIVAMAIVILAAVFSGPYAWVVSFRSWVGGVVQGTAGAVRDADAGPAAVWVAQHRDALMVAVGIVAALVWLFAELSFWGLVLLLVVVGVIELVISRAGPGREEEA